MASNLTRINSIISNKINSLSLLLHDIYNIFKSVKHIDKPYLESLLILSYHFNLSKEDIIINKEVKINVEDIKKINIYIKERINHKPISKIINKRDFFEDSFVISENVLDPRSDSEIIIYEILSFFKDRINDKLHILEIGIGSGAIILSLLKKFINSYSVGIDISDKALMISKENAIKMNLLSRIKIIKSDILSNINPKDYQFDIIISNPPYIKSEDIFRLDKNVSQYDPIIALDGGKDGLDIYRKIYQANIVDYLKDDGYLFLEIGYNMKNDVINIFNKGLKFIKAAKDLSSIDRCLIFSK